MSGDLRLFNLQRTRVMDRGRLHNMVGQMLAELFKVEEFDLTIHLVTISEMSRLNKKHMNHTGPTDVITLDYGSDRKGQAPTGEIFVCLKVAVQQAQLFQTQWQQELLRYIIHGILHLQGYDDLKEPARSKMKQAEDRLVKKATLLFPLAKMERK